MSAERIILSTEAFEAFSARLDEPAKAVPGLTELMTERKWNLEHGLTATCPVCKGAMKEGRTFCSNVCYYQRDER